MTGRRRLVLFVARRPLTKHRNFASWSKTRPTGRTGSVK